ncbi:STN domain-containing protein [Salmonirosea aquatica]|uniref:Secretin/TonB short N-terminal domain-containing protein n=1 Tax=Salmonirosea aquatica TaxID=2654236 RepID=A0A7C9F7Y3_9BACT|nr:hypothetical protein [Cytophagaceae bacterium SJW1-29]
MKTNFTFLLGGLWLLTVQAGCAQALAKAMLTEEQNKENVREEVTVQSLKKALTEIESHYGVNILADAQLLEGKTGTFRSADNQEEALRLILKPHGLVYEKIDGRTFVIIARNKGAREPKRAAPGKPDESNEKRNKVPPGSRLRWTARYRAR